MTEIAELLRGSGAKELASDSLALLNTLKGFLALGGEIAEAEMAIKATALTAVGLLDRAKRIRRRVHDMMPARNRFEV